MATPTLVFFFFSGAGAPMPPDSFGRTLPNIMHSVFEWLKSTPYTHGGVTGPLTTHFAGLALRPAYPDDLTRLGSPALAPGGPIEILEIADEVFGESSEEESYSIAVAGIVVGQGTDTANLRYRDALMSDVYKLFRKAAREGIPLYDALSNTLVGEETLEVSEVRARQVPANALEVEADRFKFTVEAKIALVVSA